MTLMNAQHDMTSLRHLLKRKKTERKRKKKMPSVFVFFPFVLSSSISNTMLTYMYINNVVSYCLCSFVCFVSCRFIE